MNCDCGAKYDSFRAHYDWCSIEVSKADGWIYVGTVDSMDIRGRSIRDRDCTLWAEVYTPTVEIDIYISYEEQPEDSLPSDTRLQGWDDKLAVVSDTGLTAYTVQKIVGTMPVWVRVIEQEVV